MLGYLVCQCAEACQRSTSFRLIVFLRYRHEQRNSLATVDKFYYLSFLHASYSFAHTSF